jgi:hypothetical protein
MITDVFFNWLFSKPIWLNRLIFLAVLIAPILPFALAGVIVEFVGIVWVLYLLFMIVNYVDHEEKNS